MHAFIDFIIISYMQAFVFSDLQYICFYYHHIIVTDLEEVRLCGLAQVWGAIYTWGLYFFTPHATTCLVFLLLVTTVYSDLFLSSFFHSIIVITCSILSYHTAPLHHATYCSWRLAFLGYFPDQPSLSHDIFSRPSSPPNTIYETRCRHRALTPGLMLHTLWPSA